MNAHVRLSVLVPLSLLTLCGASALAQTAQLDAERMRRDGATDGRPRTAGGRAAAFAVELIDWRRLCALILGRLRRGL